MDPIPPTCSRCGAASGRRLNAGLCAACLLEEGFPTAPGIPEPDDVPGFNRDVPLVQHFGPYELLEEIGRGGMGVIYKARHPGLDRLVALKMLLAGEFADAKARERLLREARIAARLSHPGIVTIHDVGEHQGRPYFAMEYVPGRNLAQHCRDGFLPIETAVRYVEEIARAVHYAHQHGVIHRDLKPANILISPDDHPKLTDFGLTKSLVDPTRTLESAGSPNFMAPEQVDSRLGTTGTATDIFGLGAILYYLLTGRPPALGESLNETLGAAAVCEPVEPRRLRPALSRDLETITLKCLERDPDRRYGSALEVAEELARWRRHEPIHARPTTSRERLVKWVRRRPLVAALSAACVLMVLIGFGGITWQWRRAEAQAEATARANYSAVLGLVRQRLEEGTHPAARRQLLSQPERFRGWEWGRLLFQAHREILEATVLTNGWTGHVEPPRGQVGVLDHAISNDRRWVACWGGGRFEVLNLTNQESVFRTGSVAEPVRDAAFSPSGEWLATAGPGPGFTIWNAGDWRRMRQCGTNLPGILSLRFSPDGRRLVVADGTRQVRLYDIGAGEEVGVLESREPCQAVRFGSDGMRVMGWETRANQGTRFTLWNGLTGQVEAEVPVGAGHFRSVELTLAADHYATVDANGVSAAWKVGAEEPWFETPPEGPEITRAILAEDHTRLLTLREDTGQARFWDTGSGHALPAAAVRFNTLTVGSDGRTLISSRNALVHLWDWRTGQPTEAMGIGDVVLGASLGVTADGRLASALMGHFPMPPTLHVWPVDPPDLRLAPANTTLRSALSPDGRTVALGHLDSRISLWDTRTGERTGWLHGHFRSVNDLAWTADGQKLFSVSSDHTVRRWDLRERRLEVTWTNLNQPVWTLSVTPDGRRVAAVDFSGQVAVWDGRSGALLQLRQMPVENELLPVHQANLSPDGRQVAVTGFSGGGVWSVEDWALLKRFNPPGEGSAFDPCGSGFTADGDRFATVDRSGRLRLWNARDWTLMAVSEAGEGATHLTFSRDGGRLFLTTCQALDPSVGEVSVEIHDGWTGLPLASLGRQKGWGSTIAFDEVHGRLLHTVMDDGSPARGTDLMEALPWRGAEFPGRADELIEDRILRLARQRHWQNLQVPRANPAPPGLPPVEPRTNWSPRDPRTPSECVDLTDAYNGHLETRWLPGHFLFGANNDLSNLPQGLVELDGIKWDIRGVVTAGLPDQFPRMPFNHGRVVSGMPVKGFVSRLHFLHAAADYETGSQSQEWVGRYRLHFADGTTADFELVLGEDIGSWWSNHAMSQCGRGTLAWEGRNPVAARWGARVRLFHRTWENPSPLRELVGVDLINESGSFVPFVVAISVER